MNAIHQPSLRVTRRAGTQRGLTLIESLMSVAVAAVVIGAVLPSFGPAVERRHLEGVAAQLATDLLFARSLAVAQNDSVRVSFRTGSGGSCYVVHSGGAADCPCATSGPSPGTTMCSNGAMASKTTFLAADSPMRVQANVASILFHPALGTSTPTGTVRVVARSGKEIRQVVNIMGRVRACTPNGVAGYAAC